jgi:hypothetical protein
MRSTSEGRLERLHGHMARNRWVASRAELLALGYPAPTIDSWLESKRLVPLFHGVYGFGRDIETAGSAWRAALLAAGSGSVLAGRTACEIWGLVGRDEGIPARIQVASERRKAIRYAGRSSALARTRVRVVRRKLEIDEVRRLDGLAVMSAPLGVIDYSAEADPVSVKFSFLEACRLGHFGQADVSRCFERIEGRRGATKVRPLLHLWVPELGQTRSVLEGLFLLAWVAQDRRMPRVNQKICGFEVDCFWPERRLIVELDGRRFHADPLVRSRDSLKEGVLRREGFRVARFTYRQVRETPDLVVQEVGRLLDLA